MPHNDDVSSHGCDDAAGTMEAVFLGCRPVGAGKDR